MKLNKVKKIKTILSTIILSTFLSISSNTYWAFWLDKINPWLRWDTNTVDQTIQLYTVAIIWFLYVIAILYWLYWWFKILTASDDDDKVKDGKKIIIRALIWIIIIFLAWPIVDFFVWTWTEEWILN